jgi:hypothetical protein
VNTYTGPLALDSLEIRYWFNCDCTTQTLQAWVDWAGDLTVGTNLTSKIIVSVVTTNQGTQTNYVSVKFTGGITVNPNDQIEVNLRFNKSDFSNMLQSNDYSYGGFSTFTITNQVTLYQNGNLIWGTEPGGAMPSLAKAHLLVADPPTPTTTPTPTPIAQSLVKIYGNIYRSGQGPLKIGLNLKQPVQTKVMLFDLTGELVMTLENGTLPAGSSLLEWNGTNSKGKPVVSGIYLLVVEVPGNQTVKKIMVLK